MDQSFNAEEFNVKHPGTFLIGLLLGSLGGVVTMLMLAPHSGKETRQQIQKKAIELYDRTSASAGTAVAKVRTSTDQARVYVIDKAKELKKQGQSVLGQGLGRISVAAENGQKAITGKAS